MQTKKLRYDTITKSLAIGLTLSLLITLCSFNARCESLSDKILRLHILANSDSAADQELKLKVRDGCLTLANELFENCENKEEAKQLATEKSYLFEQKAAEIIKENGYDYGVSVEITNCSFDTRDYADFSLPAGNYDAIRIKIGEAEGKNWWCVMFPPVCLPACVDSSISDVLDQNESKIVGNRQGYEIGFKVVEWYNEAKAFFNKKGAEK